MLPLTLLLPFPLLPEIDLPEPDPPPRGEKSPLGVELRELRELRLRLSLLSKDFIDSDLCCSYCATRSPPKYLWRSLIKGMVER